MTGRKWPGGVLGEKWLGEWFGGEMAGGMS